MTGKFHGFTFFFYSINQTDPGGLFEVIIERLHWKNEIPIQPFYQLLTGFIKEASLTELIYSGS
ncbi:MAG: hypothetical protein KAS66_08460, partial [Candidatus Omnitrophica bacterium]|nr:hypothetical protein [Candidatus Omnitrophota bacterium]